MDGVVENCSYIFDNSAIHSGRQIIAPCIICTFTIHGGRQIIAPCIICTSTIHGGRIQGLQEQKSVNLQIIGLKRQASYRPACHGFNQFDNIYLVTGKISWIILIY